MSEVNNPQETTPAPTEMVAPPPEDQHVQTVEVEVAGNMNSILAEEQVVAEKFVKRAVVIHKESDVVEKNLNLMRCYEGILYVLADRQLQSEKDDMTKGQIFDMLLDKTKLKKSTLYKRKQFAQELIDANVVSFKMLLGIEEEEKAWVELKPLLDKRLATKKGVEIQKKLGYLPSDEPKKIKSKAGKTLKEQLDEKSAQVETLLAEIKKLLEDKEHRKGIKDNTLENLNSGYAAMKTSLMKFTSIVDIGEFIMPEVPEVPNLAIGEFIMPEVPIVPIISTFPDLGVQL